MDIKTQKQRGASGLCKISCAPFSCHPNALGPLATSPPCVFFASRMSHSPSQPARVLGIDPSLRATGWAVVAREFPPGARQPSLRALGYGTIRVPAAVPLPAALARIHETLRSAIAAHQPGICALESAIFVQSRQTAITLGAVRGVVLLAAAQAGLPVVDIAPRRAKQALTGRGGAAKSQVAFMTRALLGLDHTPDPDAADALAMAIACLNQNPALSHPPLTTS